MEYFNDSKATNVGATLAAIAGMASRPQQIVLILGGDGKGADFAPLLQACISSPQTGPSAVKAVVTLGRDGPTLAALCALIYLLKKRATCLRWYKKPLPWRSRGSGTPIARLCKLGYV